MSLRSPAARYAIFAIRKKKRARERAKRRERKITRWKERRRRRRRFDVKPFSRRFRFLVPRLPPIQLLLSQNLDHRAQERIRPCPSTGKNKVKNEEKGAHFCLFISKHQFTNRRRSSSLASSSSSPSTSSRNAVRRAPAVVVRAQVSLS